MVASMLEELRDILGWSSPIGVAVFLAGVGLLFKLTGWGGRKQ